MAGWSKVEEELRMSEDTERSDRRVAGRSDGEVDPPHPPNTCGSGVLGRGSGGRDKGGSRALWRGLVGTVGTDGDLGGGGSCRGHGGEMVGGGRYPWAPWGQHGGWRRLLGGGFRGGRITLGGGCKNRSVDAKAVNLRFRWTTRLRRSDCKVSSQPDFATFGPLLGPHRRRGVEIALVCVFHSLWSEGLTPQGGKSGLLGGFAWGFGAYVFTRTAVEITAPKGFTRGFYHAVVQGLRPAGGRGGTPPPPPCRDRRQRDDG
jgi:hypothetical protein